MHVYLNDGLVPRAEAKVSVFDHGFLYGDGIYETMRAYDGVVFMIDEHLSRLFRSASLIGLTVPKSLEEIKVSLYETLKANDLKSAYIRLTVSRGYGPIGLDPDLCEKPTFIIISESLKDYPKSFYEGGIGVIVAQTKRNSRESVNPQIKSLNFLNNILAKIEAKKKGAYESLMMNVSDRLTEGTISNLFFFRDNILCTPSVECGILDGITRMIVLELAKREGMTVREGEFSVEDLYGASEVFLTNTTLEVMPVSQVDNVRYRVGEVAKTLHASYRDEVRAYVANAKESGPSLWGYE